VTDTFSETSALYDVYLLVHTYKDGEATSTFHYIPTDDAPYPDIVKVTQKMLADVYDPKEDCVQLLPVDSEPDYEFLPTDRAGTKVFQDFLQGDINLAEKK